MVREKRRPVDEKKRFFSARLLEKFHDPMNLAGSGPSVHFREFTSELVPVALHQTAHHKNLPKPPFLLSFRDPEDRPDGLLDGGLDESACVDHGDVRLLQISHKSVFLLRKPPQDVLAVHQIFGTSQADDTDFFFCFQKLELFLDFLGESMQNFFQGNTCHVIRLGFLT